MSAGGSVVPEVTTPVARRPRSNPLRCLAGRPAVEAGPGPKAALMTPWS